MLKMLLAPAYHGHEPREKLIYYYIWNEASHVEHGVVVDLRLVETDPRQFAVLEDIPANATVPRFRCLVLWDNRRTADPNYGVIIYFPVNRGGEELTVAERGWKRLGVVTDLVIFVHLLQ